MEKMSMVEPASCFASYARFIPVMNSGEHLPQIRADIKCKALGFDWRQPKVYQKKLAFTLRSYLCSH